MSRLVLYQATQSAVMASTSARRVSGLLEFAVLGGHRRTPISRTLVPASPHGDRSPVTLY